MSTEAGYPLGGVEGEGVGKKEKKPRPAAPPPSPALTTASILIRAAASRVFGLRPGSCGGDLQPIWVSEPGCSKITISLEGSARSPFPKEEAYKALIDALEVECNKLVKANEDISVVELDRATAEAKYGDGIFSKSSQKLERVRLAYVPGAALVEIPTTWSLCYTSGGCGQIQLLAREVEEGSKKKPDTMILAKKKELLVKYCVACPDAAGGEDGGEAPDVDAKSSRCWIGLSLGAWCG